MQLHCVVSGQVQGVGFRFWTKRKAQSLNLVGWVRNNMDGTVEILAQGEEKNLKKFEKMLLKGPLFAQVEKIDAKHEEKVGDFKIFEILR